MHLFYHVDHGQWQMLDDNEQREAKTRFTELIQEIRTTPDTQLLTFAVATPKADLGFMLAAWGSCVDCPADLNGDGEVNGADLGLLLAAWG